MLTLHCFCCRFFSSIFSFPNVDDCRRAASASRSARKAAAVVRGAPRANLDPNYCGRLRFRRPPNAPVGPSPVVHTGLSVNSSLPSSTPSSARLPHRVPQPFPLWEHPASFLPLLPLHRVLCWHQLQLHTTLSTNDRHKYIARGGSFVMESANTALISFITQNQARASGTRPPPIGDVDLRNALFADELVDSDALWAQRRNVQCTSHCSTTTSSTG